ncbi:MAG: TetR/AcrR family transcriptional regulator [Chloroflexota bacterium]
MSNSTRDKIVTTTAALLEKQGYAATGLNQIVKESATPRGSLYYYFPEGKEELAVEAVTHRMKEAAEFSRRFLRQIEDPIEAVYQMVLMMAKNMENAGCCGGAPIAAVALEASNSSERLRQACADGYQQLQDVLAAKLVLGGFTTEQASSLAVLINSSIEGAMILGRTNQNAAALRSVAGNLKQLMEVIKESN